MTPDFWSIASTLARAELALLVSGARAASEYAQATVRYGAIIRSRALDSLKRADHSGHAGFVPSAIEDYRAYLRELAGVARVSAVAFAEALERLRLADQRPGQEAVETRQGPPWPYRI